MDIYIWKYRRLWGLMTCGKRIYSSSNYLLRKILKGNFLLIALFSLFYVKDSELHVLCCYIWKTSLGHIDIRLLDSKQLDFWESKQLEREREREKINHKTRYWKYYHYHHDVIVHHPMRKLDQTFWLI